jgi:16S rRNA G966 N2-methylase RsmD
MYLMHKYWARKPHNVVAEYIRNYSREQEIILDPFSGSGVTAIESLRANRRTIAVDLDPMATFIARTTITPVDLTAFARAFETIKLSVKEQIYTLYQTTCTRCKKIASTSHVVWKQKTARLGDEYPIQIWYHCTCKKDIQKKAPDQKDLHFLAQVEKRKLPFWVPTNKLIWNTRINVHKGTKVIDLFTRRNLIAVSIIFNSINSLKDPLVKDLFRFVFTGFIAKSTRLNFINVGGYSSLGRGWAVRGYWVPPEHMEQNVWNDFEGQYTDVLKGKKEADSVLPPRKEAETFDELGGEKTYLIRNQSSLDLGFIPDNSVDYIFTDPPYGDSIPYLELHYLWSSWLGFTPDFDDEIIISDSPERKEKNFDMYHKMLSAAFREGFRVLKPSRWMTVTFHNTDIRTYNSIIKAIILAGFELQKIVYQPPAKPSAKGLLHPYGSAVGDYYIRFFKPAYATLKTPTTEEIDKERFNRIIVESVTKLIANRGEPTPYTFIINSYSDIYEELKKEGYLFSAPETIEDVLKSNLDSVFVLKDNRWWFKDPTRVPFIEQVPLNERVEKAVINVLNRKVKVTFDEILEEIFLKFPNSLTPETKSLREVLEEYAKKTTDGKWILSPKVKHRESEHDVMVGLLATIGELAGFTVHADLEGRRMSNFPLDLDNPERVREIDVIWFKGEHPVYEFEVENTTGITEAIIRGANLPNGNLSRVLVIPEERRKLLQRKLKEPILKEKIASFQWNYLLYRDLSLLYENAKRQGKLNLDELKSELVPLLKLKVEKQDKMTTFT